MKIGFILLGFFLPRLVSGQNDFQINHTVVIETENGDKITGIILKEDESEVILKTNYGQFPIDKYQITSVSYLDKNRNILSPSVLGEVHVPSQEARWRTIYSSMLLSNSLYGVGIPYVFDIDLEPKTEVGMRLLMFSAGFYTSIRYTKNMDLPLGRYFLQTSGMQLALLSLPTLIFTVGPEAWYEFDKNGKIAVTYAMVTVPYGMYKADKFYRDSEITNGQAYLTSSALNLGLFNSMCIISVIHNNDWKITENLLRVYALLTYGGSLGGGYLGWKYTQGKSISENDATFLALANGIGLVNSFLLANVLGLEERKPTTLVFLAGINGFTYLAEQLNKDINLKKGQTQVIALGATASWLAWVGAAILLDLEYGTKFARGMDMISITTGWYFTHRWMKTKTNTTNNDPGKIYASLHITPEYFRLGNQLGAGINLRITM